MRKEILAGYYHQSSTDKNPQHSYCSTGKDSLCKWRQAEDLKQEMDYKHPPPFNSDTLEAHKPFYNELSADHLLQKYLGGLTQKNNESLSACVWHLAPKHVSCGKNFLEMSANLAACIFNEG